MAVVPPDPAWAEWYADSRDQVVAALGDRVLGIEHVGSTSVPGLWAKPVIDIDLAVADSADEDAWLPDLEAAGFEDVNVALTHVVADGMHGAIVKAVKTREPERKGLPVIQPAATAGCC